MSTITHYLCIGCPLGCRLEVEEEEQQIIEIRGFDCKRGKEYARQEHTDPRRMVTTTVALEGGRWARLPVKTSAPVPKGLVEAVCRQLAGVTMTAPVSIGTVVAHNILDTGVDVVATRTMPSADQAGD